MRRWCEDYSRHGETDNRKGKGPAGGTGPELGNQGILTDFSAVLGRGQVLQVAEHLHGRLARAARPCKMAVAAGWCPHEPAVEPVARAHATSAAGSFVLRLKKPYGSAGAQVGDVAAFRHQAPYLSRHPPTR